MLSEKELILELLKIENVKEDGKVSFTEQAKKIIEELAERYKKTLVYRQTQTFAPEWFKRATAEDMYLVMCEKIIAAPTTLHMIMTPRVLIPVIWKKIQEEENRSTRNVKETDVEVGEKELAYATD